MIEREIMTNTDNKKLYEIGMVGLGVMGRNFLLNMADHGFPVAGYDKDVRKLKPYARNQKERDIQGAENIQ